MKFSDIKYKLSYDDMNSNEITVYHPEKSMFGSYDLPARVNWPSHGSVGIADAKVFAKALQEAIAEAERLQQVTDLLYDYDQTLAGKMSNHPMEFILESKI